ncbi:MAG: alpha/beta hydrolase family protein [Balneola sp.]
MKGIVIIIFTVLFSIVHVQAQNSLEGVWEGGISAPGGSLKVVFKIEQAEGGYEGTLDIPQQGAVGLKLNPISQDGDSVLIVFSAGQVQGTFSGNFESETKISGLYSQGGPSTPFSVERIASSTKDPQKPDNETDLIIPNGNIEIGGTLTIPEGEMNSPLVIMSSGSGAQDRDSNIFDFKIFAVLAQHLAEEGIASFRYDDRGIGTSSGSFPDATLDDLVSDVNAIINYFKSVADIKFEKFTALGHSQGGIVAGKIASKRGDIEQLILMGSTAPSLSEILRYQVNLAYENTPVDKALINLEIDAREGIMKALVEESSIDEAKQKYIEAYTNVLNNLPEVQKKSIPDISSTATNQANQLVSFFGSPQAKSLLFYVPTTDLEKINVSTLVLFGRKDTQVTISQNHPKIIEALEKSGTEYEIKVFENANHLFQTANTGLVNEYPFLAKEFTDSFLETVSTWIKEN